LKDPYSGLEAAAAMCRDHFVIETVTALPRETIPAMRLLASGEINGDPTNFWAPNVAALELMLRTFGFTRIEFIPSPISEKHPLRVGLISRPTAGAMHRTIAHAWRS
jgi:tRNA (mo5U34)-methyltransferase